MARFTFSIYWFILLIICATNAPAQNLIFSDGFNDGTTSAWSSTVPPYFPGRTCAQAADISPVVFPYQLTGTFDEDPELGPSCDGTPTNTVWFKYTPSSSGDHEIIATNHSPTNPYSRLAIFEGTSCGPYELEVGCETDNSSSVTSTVILNAGTTYLIMFFTDGESYTMVDPEITINGPPEGADLLLTNFTVSPLAVTDQQFTSASFDLTNNGTLALSSEQLLVEYYLSTDTTFGDSDDRQIGETAFYLSLASGSTQSIILSSTGLSHMTQLWTEGLVPAGNYYVFANVSLTAPPPTDPNPVNNYDRTSSRIAYNLADLSLASFTVSPSAVTDRQFTSASFVITNNGPVALSSEPLLVEYYLSTDTTFGDSDDRQIGDTAFYLSVASGSAQTIILSSTGLSHMTQLWTEGLVPAGNYYVFANVSLTDSPPADPDSSNNYDRTSSRIAYNLADLSLASFTVSPSAVTDRQFTSANFVITNNGPVALSSEPLLVEYYLSTDTTFGNSDDRQIGDTAFYLSVASGSAQTIILSSTGLSHMTQLWTEGLVPAGKYYVFANVALTAPPPNDPSADNNFGRTTFTIFYNPP